MQAKDPPIFAKQPLVQSILMFVATAIIASSNAPPFVSLVFAAMGGLMLAESLHQPLFEHMSALAIRALKQNRELIEQQKADLLKTLKQINPHDYHGGVSQ